MSEVVLKAEKRAATGKRANALLRKEGKIPAIVYGKEEENVDVSVVVKDFMRLVERGERMLKLDIEGNGKNVLVKEIQYGTYNHIILHADFRTVNDDTTIHVSVELVIEGVAPGVKLGATVEQEIHEVAIECKAKDIPSSIVVDISNLGAGQTITVADIKTPEGVILNMEPGIVAVSCHLHSEDEIGGESSEGGAEPEVIGEKTDGDKEE